MTLKNQKNHYSIKFLKGYGFSIKVKDSKIILTNNFDPFSEPEKEEWYINNMPYEKIVLSGKGYISPLVSQSNAVRIDLKEFPTNHNVSNYLVIFKINHNFRVK